MTDAPDLTLLYSPASPFARKVRCVALLRGVPLRLESATVHPVNRNGDLARDNPLAKIPVLLGPEGAIYDSRVICRIVDALGDGPRLYEVAEPWRMLTLEALADGMTDAAVALRYEVAVRPEELRWQDWVAAQQTRILAAADRLEAQVPELETVTAASIGTAVALAYLDFRHSGIDWRAGRPRLSAWHAKVGAEDWMAYTAFPAS